MRCSTCENEIATKPTKAGGDRLPRGWKRHEGIFCAKCWAERYVLRAITMPVVRPLGDGIGWPELRKALGAMWSEVTSATNWMTTQLYTGDELRQGQKKLPKMRPAYLYPETRKRFPRLPSQVCASLENAIQSKYRKKRYEVLWTCEASLPNARYPQPAAVPAKTWKPTYETAGKEGGDPIPCVSLPMLDGHRWTLQLRGGREFARQLGDFRKLVSGDAIKGEMAIIRKRADSTRNGVPGRDSGGQQTFNRVLVKMVGWFPREESRQRKGVLFLTTTEDSMVVALNAKDNHLFSIHADHIKRWCAEHRMKLQHWSDDQKMEIRGKQLPYASRREAASAKYRNRMKSAVQMIVAQVANYADRRMFSEVQWIEGTPFVSEFPWFDLHSRFSIALDAKGIKYTRKEKVDDDSSAE